MPFTSVKKALRIYVDPERLVHLVVASGIEPPTTSMSRRCSTTELRDCGASLNEGRERYKTGAFCAS
jgi:hypothetical protein